MKIILSILISVATFFTLNAFIPKAEEAKIYDACVRLHVIANSDSESDQELKLKVRDKLLEKVDEYEAKDKKEAIYLLEENKEELITLAKEVVSKEGEDYNVKIEIGLEDYPTRTYEDFSLPAGEYTSVRVIIGEGKGQNWWCAEKSNIVSFQFVPGAMRVQSSAKNMGEANEEMPIDYNGRELSIAFNADFVQAPLKAVGDSEVAIDLIDASSPGVMRVADEFLYVLMPIHV